MTRLAHVALFAVVGVAAFTIGARNGAVGTVKLLEAQARRRTEARAAALANVYDALDDLDDDGE